MNEEMLTPRQDAHTNPRIEFRDGQCLFQMVNKTGALIEKLVSYEAVREAATGIPVDSGWLGAEVVRWGTGRLGDWCVAFIPPAFERLELAYIEAGGSERIEHIIAPLPGMVIFGIALKYFVFAVKTDKCDPFQEIFRAPLPNTNEEGEVCWGNLKPTQASPRTIVKTWQLFITSTFNNHFANGKSKSQREDVREVLKALAAAGMAVGEEPRYPSDDLIRQVERTGVTLDAAVKHFFETGEMPS